MLLSKMDKNLQYEDSLDEVNDYFNNCTEDILLEASTLIYDKVEKELIGACLVSCVEEWPLIHTVGVILHIEENILQQQ